MSHAVLEKLMLLRHEYLASQEPGDGDDSQTEGIILNTFDECIEAARHVSSTEVSMVIDEQGVQRLPEISGQRAECGPMQFGGDWPGVFLRGDHACWFAMVLKVHLKESNPFSAMLLEGLSTELGGCNVLELKDRPSPRKIASQRDHRLMDTCSVVLGGVVGEPNDGERLKAAIMEGSGEYALSSLPSDPLDTAVDLAIAWCRFAQDLKIERNELRRRLDGWTS